MNFPARNLQSDHGSRPARRKLRLCLAASGGGHLHELLDLRAFWEEHDRYFVTEPTPIAGTLARSERDVVAVNVTAPDVQSVVADV